MEAWKLSYMMHSGLAAFRALFPTIINRVKTGKARGSGGWQGRRRDRKGGTASEVGKPG